MASSNYNFKTIQDLICISTKQQIPIHEIMMCREEIASGLPRTTLRDRMKKNLSVMEQSRVGGMSGVSSVTGLTGMDALRLKQYIDSGKAVAPGIALKAVCYAIAVNETNASMGIICASPTAGSCGVLPGVLFALAESRGMTEEEMVDFLFVSGAYGLVIANNASISGAAGGCQAEVGSASGMAAAAAVLACGGSAQQSAHGCAIALKNLLGLVCDPVAGLVEIPCIKRNAIGANNALTSCDMALAGIESKIPCDEVIGAMFEVGNALPATLRETAGGGLAATPTGRKLAKGIK